MTFHGLFKFSKTFGLAGTFKNLKKLSFFRVFLDLKQFNRHKLWCPPKCAPFELFNYSSLSNYIVFAFTPAVTSLWNKSSMTFKDRLLNSMTFKAWKMKYLNFMTFQVLHDRYEPCSTYASKQRPLLIHQKATAITLLLSTWATVKQKVNRNTSNNFVGTTHFPL